MNPTAFCKVLLATLAAVLLVTPCFSGDLVIRDAPQWVNQGTTLTKVHGHRLFHGVGSAPIMGDRALQRAAAEGRARRELARILSSYMDALSGDCLGTAKSGDPTADEETTARQFKDLAKAALAEAKIGPRWRDERTGMLYSRMQLDLRAAKNIAVANREINARARAYVQEHGDRVFDSVSKGAR